LPRLDRKPLLPPALLPLALRLSCRHNGSIANRVVIA
jgi:hypothetical protein